MRFLALLARDLSSIYLFCSLIAPCIAASPQGQIPLKEESLDAIPRFLNFSSSAPLLTHSLATLLQQWPQTFFPNGHTITSVHMPRHTLLYHGRHDTTYPPPSPEWLAFDIEMAYGIMGSMQDSRMLTYRTKKDVKAVYFDGMSASLMGEGTKSQMVVLYNGTDGIPGRGAWGPPGSRPSRRPPHEEHESDNIEDDKPDPRRPPGHWNPLEDEYFRARGLCNWLKSRGLGGRGWGFEAIVRMNAGFEVIWCDFESPSLQLVSNLNVSTPRLEESVHGPDMAREWSPSNTLAKRGQVVRARLADDDTPEGPHGPGMADPSEPFEDKADWMWFAAATKRYSGEPRVKVDTCALFSFYDPDVTDQSFARLQGEMESFNISANGKWEAPEDDSQREAGLEKLMRRRRHHHLGNVTDRDGAFMSDELERRFKSVLKGPKECSGIDWHIHAQQLVATFNDNLQNLRDVLMDEVSESREGMHAWLKSVRAITHWILMPYLEYPSGRPYEKESLRILFDMNSETAKTTFERCKSQYDVGDIHLDDGETTIAAAIEETLAGICSVAVLIGMDVEYEWLMDFNSDVDERDSGTVDEDDFLEHVQTWKKSIEELMAWLGWAEQWTSCQGPCASNELCFIPIWPVADFPRGGRRPPPKKSELKIDAPPGFPGWDRERYLWQPICVNASSYPP